MSDKALLATTVSCALGLALALGLLLWGRGSRIDLGRVLVALLLVALFAALQVVAGRLLGGSFFLAVSVAYVDTFVLVPLVGLALLIAARTRPVDRAVRVLAWSSFVLIPIGIDASFIEPYRLVTETTNVPLSPAREGRAPITIAVLSDIQVIEVSDRERDAVARAMAAKPDLILVTGDLVQVGTHRLPEILPSFHTLLAPLDAPLGVWFVQGNCETKEEAALLIRGTHVRLLDNQVVEERLGDRRVSLCGVDLAFASPAAKAALAKIESMPGEGDVRIVFAHRPDVLYALSPRTRVDLIVAGHTHGGQVQIPFFGPLIILSSVPRSVGAGGLHELDGRRVYVSRGIGWEHGHAPRVRFLCPPEVSILHLGSP